MSAAKAVMEARAAGIKLGVEGNDLVLEAASPPPDSVLRALCDHKAGIIDLLRPSDEGWSAQDWHVYFDERAGVAEFHGGQTRDQAEATAFECCIVEWLNRHLCRSNPSTCAACSAPDRSGSTVVPFGTEGHGHTWLHPECWEQWHQERRERATGTLAAIGVRGPTRCPKGISHAQQTEAHHEPATEAT